MGKLKQRLIEGETISLKSDGNDCEILKSPLTGYFICIFNCKCLFGFKGFLPFKRHLDNLIEKYDLRY